MIPGALSKSLKAWKRRRTGRGRRPRNFPKLQQAGGGQRPRTSGPRALGAPQRRRPPSQPPQQKGRIQPSHSGFSTQAPRVERAAATPGQPLSPGRRRRWSLVSVSRHKGKDLRRHADESPEAATAGATRTPLGLGLGPRRSLCPGRLGVPRRRRPLGSAARGLQARRVRLRLGLQQPADTMRPESLPARRHHCGRPVADTKAHRPRPSRLPGPATAHRPWAPAPGSRSVLVTAFQTLQPSRQKRSAADLLISAPQGPGRLGLADHRDGAARQGRPGAAPPSMSPGSARAGPAARLAAPPPGAAPGSAAHGRSLLRAPRWVSPKSRGGGSANSLTPSCLPPRPRAAPRPRRGATWRPRRRAGRGPRAHEPRSPPRCDAPSTPPARPRASPRTANAFGPNTAPAPSPPVHPMPRCFGGKKHLLFRAEAFAPVNRGSSGRICVSGRGLPQFPRYNATCSYSGPSLPMFPKTDLTPSVKGLRKQNPYACINCSRPSVPKYRQMNGST